MRKVALYICVRTRFQTYCLEANKFNRALHTCSNFSNDLLCKISRLIFSNCKNILSLLYCILRARLIRNLLFSNHVFRHHVHKKEHHGWNNHGWDQGWDHGGWNSHGHGPLPITFTKGGWEKHHSVHDASLASHGW